VGVGQVFGFQIVPRSAAFRITFHTRLVPEATLDGGLASLQAHKGVPQRRRGATGYSHHIQVAWKRKLGELAFRSALRSAAASGRGPERTNPGHKACGFDGLPIRRSGRPGRAGCREKASRTTAQAVESACIAEENDRSQIKRLQRLLRGP